MKQIIKKQTKIFIRDDFTFNPETEIGLEVEPAQGLYWPKWDGKQWVEGRTQAEIDAIKATAEQAEPDIVTVMTAEIVSLKERLAKVEAVPLVKTALEPIIKDPILTR